MNELFNLHKQYDSVKARDKYLYSNNFFWNVYPFYFSQRRTEKLKILEMGVYKGGSLRAMRDYFPKANIVGLDVVDICKDRIQNWDRIKFFMGSQSDKELLHKIGKEEGPFDFIIDDAGHKYPDQVISFETLFPYVLSGGVYFVEDIINRHNARQIMEYFRELTPYDRKRSFDKQPISCISFHQGLIAITKSNSN